MPDPKKLKVGDWIRFVCMPEDWQSPKFVHRDSLRFMKAMVERRRPSRLWMIDEYGNPLIRARIRSKGGTVHHSWALLERSGWRRVQRRQV